MDIAEAITRTLEGTNYRMALEQAADHPNHGLLQTLAKNLEVKVQAYQNRSALHRADNYKLTPSEWPDVSNIQSDVYEIFKIIDDLKEKRKTDIRFLVQLVFSGVISAVLTQAMVSCNKKSTNDRIERIENQVGTLSRPSEVPVPMNENTRKYIPAIE